MKTFTDSAGRTWTIALTIDAVKRVKSLLDVNLLELDLPAGKAGAGDPPLLTRLGTDVILLCDVIFALIKPQADAAGISDQEFAAALGGDVVLAMQTAFYEELVDFFRKLGRGDLAKAVDAQRRMIDLAVARIETRINRLDLEAAVESTLGEPSMSSPQSSESTPAR